MEQLNKKCKHIIDKNKITVYNAVEISNYADKNYLKNRFDEVEAEYMVKQKLGAIS